MDDLTERCGEAAQRAAGVTPWFHWSERPVRLGVYEVKETDGYRWFNRWDGRHWHEGCYSPADAARVQAPIPRDWVTDWVFVWRGLTKAAPVAPHEDAPAE